MSNKYWNIVPLVLLLGLAAYAWRGRTVFQFVPNDVKVTIPEGTNIADVDRLIAKAGIFPQGTLLTKANLALEGTLFPNTYRFDRDSSAEDVIVRMQKNYPDRQRLIIASLLEKEVQTPGDMRLVADIIKRRLAAGIPLQIDATVAYGACYQKFVLSQYCDVSQVNLVDNIKRDSAYNTYTRQGLPVGPITNPGQAALEAAANPTPNAYWFYLSAPDGTTIFSKTLEEHNRAKRTYL